MERIFTYGTLRPSLYKGAIERFNLIPGAKGIIHGFSMFSLGWFPCIVPSSNVLPIFGEIAEIDDLKAIDRYEGYSANGKGLYDRRKIKVTLSDGTEVEAWVYFMNQNPKDVIGTLIESGDWSTHAERKPIGRT